MFKNKILLITGGTASFRNAVLDRFLESNVKEIRIFSRDEKNKMICVRNIPIRKLNFTLETYEIFKA